MNGEQYSTGSGSELGRFLRARRAEVTPAQAGLTAGLGLRRTPGLRREELATLAGVSVDYYTRLERGKETRPSPAVVDALARALRLDQTEHEHLHDLAARATRRGPEPPAAPSRTVSPGVKLLLESLRPGPAYVVSRTMDVLAANPGGLALYTGLEDWAARQRNLARYVFLHPGARELFEDWGNQVRGCVARLRALAGTDPDAPRPDPARRRTPAQEPRLRPPVGTLRRGCRPGGGGRSCGPGGGPARPHRARACLQPSRQPATLTGAVRTHAAGSLRVRLRRVPTGQSASSRRDTSSM